MGKYLFNVFFKEIADTYYIDSNALGNVIDRDASRIRHYKTDSKPGKAILDKLIQAICGRINEVNDSYINQNLIERLNHAIIYKDLFNNEIRGRLSEIERIDTYISFLLKKSLKFSGEPLKTDLSFFEKPAIPMEKQSLITKAGQAHQYYENNLYQEAVDIYEGILSCPELSELHCQRQLAYTDLGIIYRNYAISKYDSDLLKKSIDYLETASKISYGENDLSNYALINKYLGTDYSFLYNFENSEANLKKAAQFYDISLSVLFNIHQLEEHAKVLINYGILFVYYSNIRNSRNFLMNAICYFKKAIDYYESRPDSFFKALAYLNCSSAYTALAENCNTEANTRHAAEMLKSAMKIFTIEDFPIQYAQCLSNLGLVYYIKANCIETVGNCRSAIDYIEQALDIVPEEKDTNSYLIAKLNLSAIYILLSQSTDKQANIKKAMQNLDDCMKYNNIRSSSINDFKVNLNYSEALMNIAEVNNDIKLLATAECILKDLQELSEQTDFGYFGAVANHDLSNLYLVYYKMTQQSDYLEQAAIHANQSLKIFSVNDYPIGYALSTHLLAKVHSCRQEYQAAIKAYESVLNIFTCPKYPEKYRMISEEYKELIEKQE